jgi:hypothetical protein
MVIVTEPIRLEALARMAEERFGNMVKVVVEIELWKSYFDAFAYAARNPLAQG